MTSPTTRIALAACAALIACDAPADDAATTQQEIFGTTLKGANWLRFENYSDLMNDARRVSWNLETPGFGAPVDAQAVSNLSSAYGIKTLVRIGDEAKPSDADRAALASGSFNCTQLAGWMGRLDAEAAHMNSTIALNGGAIAAFIFGNETNIPQEWNTNGAQYARAYGCYRTHWKGIADKGFYPLLVSGPGGCGNGMAINCTTFYGGLKNGSGALGTVDGFAIHAYGSTSFKTWNDLGGFQDQANFINTFRNGSPIYITEYGMGGGQPPTAGGNDYFNARFAEVGTYNASHGGQIKALLYFVDALLWNRGVCVNDTGDQWYAFSLCKDVHRNMWRSANSGGSNPPPPPPPSTCDNNVPVGSTACNPSDAIAQFMCARPGTSNQWDRQLCSSGQRCVTNRCQVVAQQTCDNNVPVGGTACNPSDAVAQFQCARPGTSNQWDRQLCGSGQRCVGNRCQVVSTQTCDNGIPLNGTACNGGDPGAQYVCTNPSIPSPGQWTRQACAAGHSCVGTHCN